MSRILVLGGTGAMGVYLLPELAKMGYEVYCTSRSKRENKNGIAYLCGNAKDINWVNKVVNESPFDVIIDFMIYWNEDFASRADLFLNATKHYIFLSSYRVYADSKIINEESPRLLDVTSDITYLKSNEYALLKAREEDVLFENSQRNWTIVRPTITYSKERFQLGTFEGDTLLHRAMHKLPVALPKELLDTETTLSWGGDVAKMIARLVLNEKAYGEVFNVCTSEHYTWQYVANLYQKAIGLETKVCQMKEYEQIHLGHYAQLRYDRMYNRIMDNSKVLSVTGLTQADMTPLHVALPRELAAFPNIRYEPNIDQCARLDMILRTRTSLLGISPKKKIGYFVMTVPVLRKILWFSKRIGIFQFAKNILYRKRS